MAEYNTADWLGTPSPRGYTGGYEQGKGYYDPNAYTPAAGWTGMGGTPQRRTLAYTQNPTYESGIAQLGIPNINEWAATQPQYKPRYGQGLSQAARDAYAAQYGRFYAPFGGPGSGGTGGTAGTPGTPGTQDTLASLMQKYFGPQGGLSNLSSGASNILQKFLEAESQFIPEMMSGDYRSTKAGAAAYESAAGPINAHFDSLKQTVLQNAAQQGISPTSGLVQGQLDEVEHERTQALSDLERQFNAGLPGRQEAGLSQLSSLLGIEQQRELQALGIEQALDEATRQRFLDAATLGGNQGAAAAMGAGSQAGNLLNAASRLSDIYGQRAADQSYGLGSMLGSFGNYFRQPQQGGYGMGYGGGNYGFYNPGLFGGNYSSGGGGPASLQE